MTLVDKEFIPVLRVGTEYFPYVIMLSSKIIKKVHLYYLLL